MAVIRDTEVTAVILAGGRARRMGGQDKGLLQFEGKPLVSKISDQLKRQCSTVTINANRNLEQYRALGMTVFSDEMEGYQGPLAGMHTALKRMQTPWLITAPCDGPFIDEDYVNQMRQKALDHQHTLAVASLDGRLQPVYALIHKTLEVSLKRFLRSDERKIDRWFYQQTAFSIVEFDHSPTMFININTPEEFHNL